MSQQLRRRRSSRLLAREKRYENLLGEMRRELCARCQLRFYWTQGLVYPILAHCELCPKKWKDIVRYRLEETPRRNRVIVKYLEKLLQHAEKVAKKRASEVEDLDYYASMNNERYRTQREDKWYKWRVSKLL